MDNTKFRIEHMSAMERIGSIGAACEFIKINEARKQAGEEPMCIGRYERGYSGDMYHVAYIEHSINVVEHNLAWLVIDELEEIVRVSHAINNNKNGEEFTDNSQKPDDVVRARKRVQKAVDEFMQKSDENKNQFLADNGFIQKSEVSK